MDVIKQGDEESFRAGCLAVMLGTLAWRGGPMLGRSLCSCERLHFDAAPTPTQDTHVVYSFSFNLATKSASATRKRKNCKECSRAGYRSRGDRRIFSERRRSESHFFLELLLSSASRAVNWDSCFDHYQHALMPLKRDAIDWIGSSGPPHASSLASGGALLDAHSPKGLQHSFQPVFASSLPGVHGCVWNLAVLRGGYMDDGVLPFAPIRLA